MRHQYSTAILALMLTLGQQCCANEPTSDVNTSLQMILSNQDQWKAGIAKGFSLEEKTAVERYNATDGIWEVYNSSESKTILALPLRVREAFNQKGLEASLRGGTYEATLSKSEKSGSWALDRFVPLSANPLSHDPEEWLIKSLGDFSVIHIEYIPIYELFKSSDTKILDVSVAENGLIEVQFNSKIASRVTKLVLTSGILRFSNDHMCLLSSAEVLLQDSDSGESIALEVKNSGWLSSQQISFPQSVTTTYSVSGALFSRAQRNFTNFQIENVPKSRFTLSHYGLVEPVNASRDSKMSMFVIVNVLALLLVGVGLIVRYFVR